MVFLNELKPPLEEVLEHYGVLGMKWGVRKDRASGRTKSFNDSWFAKLANKNAQRHIRKQIEKGEQKAKKQLIKDAKKGLVGLDPVIIGAGLLAATIAIQKVRLFKDSGRKDAKETGDREFKQNKDLTKKMTTAQLQSKVVKQINPDYGERGTKMNCRRATLAYEMRRRGNDVKATKSKMASGQTDKGMEKAVGAKFTNSIWGEKEISTSNVLIKSNPQQKADLIFADLAKNPNGARGELGVAWSMGGGHSVAWEIVNGKPVIFDTQNSETFTNAKKFAKFTPVIYAAGQTRLDNKSIDPEFIKRWVTDV